MGGRATVGSCTAPIKTHGNQSDQTHIIKHSVASSLVGLACQMACGCYYYYYYGSLACWLGEGDNKSIQPSARTPDSWSFHGDEFCLGLDTRARKDFFALAFQTCRQALGVVTVLDRGRRSPHVTEQLSSAESPLFCRQKPVSNWSQFIGSRFARSAESWSGGRVQGTSELVLLTPLTFLVSQRDGEGTGSIKAYNLQKLLRLQCYIDPGLVDPSSPLDFAALSHVNG